MFEQSSIIKVLCLVSLAFTIISSSLVFGEDIDFDPQACLDRVKARERAKCFVNLAATEFNQSRPNDHEQWLMLGVTHVLTGQSNVGVNLINDAPEGAPVDFSDKADALANAGKGILAKQAYLDAADKLFEPGSKFSKLMLNPGRVASLAAEMTANGFPKLAFETIGRLKIADKRRYFSTARQLIDIGTPEAMKVLELVEDALVERAHSVKFKWGNNDFIMDAKYLFNWGRTSALEEIVRILVARLENETDENLIRKFCYSIGSAAAHAGQFEELDKVYALAPHKECEWPALFSAAAVSAFQIGQTELYEKYLILVKNPQTQANTIVKILSGHFNIITSVVENVKIEPSERRKMMLKAISFAREINPTGIINSGPKQFRDIAKLALDFGELKIANRSVEASYEIAKQSLTKRWFHRHARELFIILARLGDFDRIREIAKTTNDPDFRSFGRRAIAIELLRKGNRAGAFREAKVSQSETTIIMGRRLGFRGGQDDVFVLHMLAKTALDLGDEEALSLAIHSGCCDDGDLYRMVGEAQNQEHLNVLESVFASSTEIQSNFIQFIIADSKAKNGQPSQMVSLLPKLKKLGRVCGLTRLALYELGRADIIKIPIANGGVLNRGASWRGHHCFFKLMK